MDPGVHYGKTGNGSEEWIVVAGKQDGEWRGRAIAVKKQLGVIRHRQVGRNGLGVTLATAEGHVGVLNVHLPPKYTLNDTGKQLEDWKTMQAAKEHRLVVLGDLSETFTRAEETDAKGLTHRTARGALITQWFEDIEVEAPPQQIHVPSCHPYNRLHQPRRLDYVMLRKLRYAGEGRVVEIRNVAASDHDAVMVPILTGRPAPAGKVDSAHGPKQLKEGRVVQSILRNLPATADWGHQIKQAARAIAENRKNYRGYRESSALKRLRRQAMQATPRAEARELWKQVWNVRRQERDGWQKGLLEAALAEDWQALRAIKTARRRHQWEEVLTTQPDWEKTMREHFHSIFAKQAAEQVKAEMAAVWEHLTALCKTTRWRPFTTEELTQCTTAWAGGKSTGPDGISYEALRVMGMHDRWEPRLREEFNDALYKGRCSPLTKKSATILLPKEAQPADWGQTRPITLSSSMLKWQAQLILGRVGEPIMRQARFQFARPGRQAAELILLLRRAIRVECAVPHP